MQGQSPAVSISAQTGTNPTQNANKEWTCQRWFNNIATKVSTKTHRYVGKFVAVVTLPIIFIPSLARDLICGTKNLYQRAVSKTPVVNQVSTKGTTSATPAVTQSDNTVESHPVVRPDSVRANSSHTSPTIEQLRQDFPELNQVLSAMEASAEENVQQLAEYKIMNRQLDADLDLSQQRLANRVMQCNRQQRIMTELQLKLEESTAKNYRHADEINDLNRVIERQNADFKELLATHQKLTGRMNKLFPGHSPFAKLDPVVEEPCEKEDPQALSHPDGPHNSDQAEVIVLEEEITSSSRDDAELVDIVVLSDAIVEPESEDQDEPVLPITTPAQESQESSLVAEAPDSDDSFENINQSDVATAMGIPHITITNHDQPTEVKADVK